MRYKEEASALLCSRNPGIITNAQKPEKRASEELLNRAGMKGFRGAMATPRSGILKETTRANVKVQ